MDAAVLDILVAADDPVAYDNPASFDWKASLDRVRPLKPVCDRIAGRDFDLDEHVQDASFFAEIALHAPSDKPRVLDVVFALRFSCFGGLFTGRGPTGNDRLPPDVTCRLIEAVSAAGFRYVPPAMLDEPYRGRHPAFSGTTWWYRLFDWH